MSADQNHSDLIRAMARGDWGTADRLLAEIGDKGLREGPQTITAAFFVAAQRRFGETPDLQQVATFVATTRQRYADGHELPALAMEGMIRAALGEPDLIDDIDAETAFSMQIAVLGTLLQDREWTEAELEEFIREVEQTAAQYM
ncbi:hypothetical protein O7632_02425 [Solwaraspora sp. WMMD406]|uniref:hypothetical protein n=1 Tax=Solwaraspora sp. WMMD406 TaxID=3016095 RepID=UPI002417DB6B|nr:hypothetical protein [Solwaraspora sp. WMMD406]MDG4762972.1 hypothetical protein [Solwaraspora sp. WMMD406]